MKFKKLVLGMAAAAACASSVVAWAEAINQVGQAEVSIKSHKDPIAARAAARRQAEYDAIRAALKLRLNVEAKGPKADEAIGELVKNFGPNLKTTYVTEGDILTARTTLSVDSAELTDLSRSLGLQNANVMEAASIVFLIDEYWGIATNLDPSKPIVSEVEFFQDKSSSSDTSSRSSGASFSDTSSKSSSASSYQGSMAASSRESSSYAANRQASVAGSQSSSFAGSDRRAAAVQDGYGGSAAAARDTQVAGAQRSAYAGSSQSSVAAAASSDTRVASSVNASSASASDRKNVQSGSFAQQQNNIVNQKDVTSFKSKTVFPDLNNAKPADAASALIAQRLAQVTRQYGLEYTPERDLRETGKGKMLISDIETQGKFEMYAQKAAKNPFNAKYVVFGSSVMNAEGKSASGRTLCSGMLKLDSFNVNTGRGLVVGTLVKRADGSSDQDCRSNLASALATELAQTVGNAATRELQRLAQMGQSYTVTLFSSERITRGIGGGFEDALRELVGELREDRRTESTRVYTMSSKGGDLARRIERMLDKLGAEMKNAEVQTKGNRVVVCVEGRCPADY
ncbi:hypothetical protein ACT80S_11035 [Ramlibacter sp. MAHUQ-53]|uniref:hypothetical protein n=1 Tax=unclassified Ramlibacter TaxID=2617605 RepID=UPI003634BF2A